MKTIIPSSNGQTIMNHPHDNWAKYYDFVYNRTYGNVYHNFTTETLQLINRLLPSGTIIDYGASTGRLSIPLKQKGYDVIAVEQSAEMINVLTQKCSDNNLDIPTCYCSIADYNEDKADLALAVFTVLSYATSEEELAENIKAIATHIKPNGYFLFDLPNAIFFNLKKLVDINAEDFTRVVQVLDNDQNDLYTYKESCTGNLNGEEFRYKTEFMLRNWSLSTLDKVLNEYGMIDTMQAFPQFSSTGSTYKLYQKQL